MEKRTMGALMSALRKSKGMTQQDVADKLGVSNKAVSKWECDDGYPDIMILPAIAEIYGVTVDELLRGEIRNEEKEEKNFAPEKGIKQIEALLANAYMKYKTLSMIAIVVAVLSLITGTLVQFILYRFIYSTLAVIFSLIPVTIGVGASVILEWYASSRFLFALSGEDARKCEDKLYNYYKTVRNHVAVVACTVTLSVSVIVSGCLAEYLGLIPIPTLIVAVCLALFGSLLLYLFLGNKLMSGLESEEVKKTIAYNKKTGKRLIIGLLCIAIGVFGVLTAIDKLSTVHTYHLKDEETFDAFEAYTLGKYPIVSVDEEKLTVTYVDYINNIDAVEATYPAGYINNNKDELFFECDGYYLTLITDTEKFDNKGAMERFIKKDCIQGYKFLMDVPMNLLENYRKITNMDRDNLKIKTDTGYFLDLLPVISIVDAIACAVFAVIYPAVRAKRRVKCIK